jgi:hypothetical protein
MPVCYGDYNVTVDITGILVDPNTALKGMDSVQVCYKTAMNLVAGEKVEVNGYYWAGGTCPKQYCKRVQVSAASDYITRVVEYGDNDWMVSGDLMYSIPSGNVGIGTSHPSEKLHVVGNLLVQGASPVWLKLRGVLGDDAGISLTTTGVGVNTWEVLREGASSDLVVKESFPYPPFGGDRVVVKARTGNVGIGTSEPEYRLDLPNTADTGGQGRANAWKTYSSQRWKTNVQTIDHAMDKVRSLRGVSFDWRDQGKHDIGLIAEEVGKVVPEVVDYEANGKDATALAYDRLVAVLVEALKEQDGRIAELEQMAAQNKRLEQRLEVLEHLVQQRQVVSVDEQVRP